MSIIVGCDPSDIATHCSEKVIEMDNFIHLTGDSWNFWSPFPPTVTSWLIDVSGPAFAGGNHPRRQLSIERCRTGRGPHKREGGRSMPTNLGLWSTTCAGNRFRTSLSPYPTRDAGSRG
jgi:hypothetical protein